MLNLFLSLFFRLILIIYAIFILIIESNSLHFSVYVLSLLLYPILFIAFRRKNNELNSTLRLLNDYIFISVILYNKEANVLNLCFLLTPIINSSNYTGKYNSIASLRVYSAAFCCLLVMHEFKPNATWLIPLMLFWLLSVATKGREFVKSVQSVLVNPIGQISLEQITPYSTHKNRALKEVVEEFNKKRFLKFFHPSIKTAICFKIRKNDAIIISASELIENFKMDANILIKNFSKLEKENFASLKISANGIEVSNESRLMYSNKIGSSTYLYYVEFSIAPLSPIIPVIRRILSHTFGALSNVFEIEDTIKKRRLRLVKNLKKQTLFLERSTNNIHFVNNKLSPLLEYFTLSHSINNGHIVADAEVLAILQKLFSRSHSNIQMISSRLAKHLDKRSNPFSSAEYSKLTVEQIVISVINTWVEHDLSIDFLDVIPENRLSLKNELNFQSEYFELVLDEIIENIIKYRYSFYKLSITIFKNEMVFRFSNDVKPSPTYTEDLKKLSNQFNADSVNEMLKRNSHGISMIKNFLLHMGVKSNLNTDRHIYTLTLTINFNPEQNENSNF